MRRIGLQLVREKQRTVLDEQESHGGTALEKGKDKDLLSLLIKSNMDKDLPAGQQLTVGQILNQIPTFLVAGERCNGSAPSEKGVLTIPYPYPYSFQGHETTSTSTTWTLFALACHPEIQTKLREELRAFPHDSPSMDDLNSFQYLDAVVREGLRLYPTLDTTLRALGWAL